MADINVIVPNRDVKHISKLYNLFGQVFLGAIWNAVKLQIMFSRVLFQVINLVYSGSKVFGHCVVIFFDFFEARFQKPDFFLERLIFRLKFFTLAI